MDTVPTIGNSPKEVKDEAARLLRAARTSIDLSHIPEDKRKEILENEIEKPQEILGCIRASRKVVDAIMRDAGLPSFEVDERKIHLLPPFAFEDVTGISDAKWGEAAVVDMWQEIFVRVTSGFGAEDHSIIRLAHSIFHEILHMAAYFAIRVDGPTVADSFMMAGRWGSLSTHYRGDGSAKREYGHGLMEAMDEDIVKEYFPMLLDELSSRIPTLAGIRHKIDAMRGVVPTETLKSIKEYGFGADDVIWIGPLDFVEQFSYPKVRAVLNYVSDAICAQDTRRFPNPTSVRRLFRKANFDGDFKEVAALVNKAFGKTGFKVLMAMDKTDDSADKTLKRLHSLRAS